MSIARLTPDKTDFGRIIEVLSYELNQSGAVVKLGTEATVEIIKQENPDVVIVSTGALPATPPIEGLDNAKVIQAWDYIEGEAEAEGREIVVIGGNATGCEAALLVAQEGTIDSETLSFLFYHEAEDDETLRKWFTQGTKKVTVVEMLPRMAENVARTTRWALLKDLSNYNVNMMSKTTVIGVSKDGVVVERDGKQEKVPADTIIMATGVKSRNELHEELKDQGIELLLIGDARFPRKIADAISDGFNTALKI